jgi:hypothetical protein
MKKVFFVIMLLTLGFSIRSYANLCFHGQTHIFNDGTPQPNGPMTYGTVDESEDHTVLTCEKPGSKSCKWADGTVPHGVGIVVGTTVYTINDVLLDARTQVGNGILSGMVTGSGQTGYYSWHVSGNMIIVDIEICY